MLDRIAQLCLSHFLCQFDPKSRKRLTRDVVREVASAVYAQAKVDEFIDLNLAQFQSSLVNEFNKRFADGRPLRYQIADAGGTGDMVVGNWHQRLASEIQFQNSLHRLQPREFELLS